MAPLFTALGDPDAPREQRRSLLVLRALAEATGAGGLMLLTYGGFGEGFGETLDSDVMLALGTAMLALLVVRRRFPAVSLLGAGAIMGLLPAAGLPVAVIAYTTARRQVVPRRRAAVLLGASGLAMLTAAVSAPFIGMGSHIFGLALGTVLSATVVVVPGLLGTSTGQQERLLRALRERTAAAEEARRLADSESRIHERSRIAAEMHDLVGHRLSLISLHAGGLEMALQSSGQSAELRDEAALVRRATGDAMRELREVLGVLGPLARDTGTSALTDATGTRADVEALVEESRRGGIPVEFAWHGADLDGREARVRRAVHRVVRESLTNVHRYAAGAHVTVTVTHTDERVEIVVRNGVRPRSGPEPGVATGLGSGRGLTGLRERVALLGGSLEAGPTESGGFAVTAVIPAEPGVAAGTGDGGSRAGESDYGPSDHGLSDYGFTEAHGADAGTGHPPPRRAFSDLPRRAVSALTGLLGLAGVGVMMLFGIILLFQARPDPGYRPPEEPRIGMDRDKVMEAVWGDSEAVRAAATGREPAHPESATSCVYPMVGAEEALPARSDRNGSEGAERAEGAEGPGRLRITRYCFERDTLIAIDRFTVPMVSRTPPWKAG
ncbi:sensor histidine kinase [Streptomyces sp. NPDC002851]